MSPAKKQRSSTTNLVITVLVALAALAYFSSGRSAGNHQERPQPERSSAPTPGDAAKPAPGDSAQVASGGPGVPSSGVVTQPPAAPGTQADAFVKKMQANNELPDDLKRQLAAPPPELPEDLKAQLHAPPPELPEDLKQQMLIPPRTVTIDEVNHPKP